MRRAITTTQIRQTTFPVREKFRRLPAPDKPRKIVISE
jgi:hypothetical protein